MQRGLAGRRGGDGGARRQREMPRRETFWKTCRGRAKFNQTSLSRARQLPCIYIHNTHCRHQLRFDNAEFPWIPCPPCCPFSIKSDSIFLSYPPASRSSDSVHDATFLDHLRPIPDYITYNKLVSSNSSAEVSQFECEEALTYQADGCS